MYDIRYDLVAWLSNRTIRRPIGFYCTVPPARPTNLQYFNVRGIQREEHYTTTVLLTTVRLSCIFNTIHSYQSCTSRKASEVFHGIIGITLIVDLKSRSLSCNGDPFLLHYPTVRELVHSRVMTVRVQCRPRLCPQFGPQKLIKKTHSR